MQFKNTSLARQEVVCNSKQVMLREAWLEYDNFISDLPESFANVARDVINNRELRQKFIAGLHFPLWFAEALNERSEECIRKLALGSLYLYLYVVIVDDRLDEHIENSQEVSLVADLHLVEALKYFESILGNRKFFWDKFQEILKGWFIQDRALVEQYKNKGYDCPRLESYASKCAILKASGLVLASRCRDYKKWHVLSKAYDLTAISNTFIDDLTDWKEDIKSGHKTYLISKALKEFGFNKDIDLTILSQNEIAMRVYQSNAIGESLKLALKYIDEAKRLFTLCGAGFWLNFVLQMESNIRDVNKGWMKIKNGKKKDILEFDALLKDKFAST